MPNQTEHNRQMAMFRAAIPYVAPENRHAIEVLLQADALIHTARQSSYPLNGCNLEAAEFDEEGGNPGDYQVPFKSDPEKMLVHIQEYCTPRESDMIQTILNFMHADKLFRGYQEFQKSHPAAEGSELSAASAGPLSSSPLGVLLHLINGLGALGGNFMSDSLSDAAGKDGKGKGPAAGNQLMEFLFSQLNPDQKSTFEQLQHIMYN